MVELPGSLERSTLGDVLGALHRDGVTGTLWLREGAAHQHVITWRDGLIHHVETTRRRSRTCAPAARRAAERWTQDDPHRFELRERLEALFELERATLRFSVMSRTPPRTPRPLGPSEFLHGRRRSRDAAPRGCAPPPIETRRARALRTLGLEGEPGADAVRAAFRQLARRWHPDLHPGLDEPRRADLCRRFAEIAGAYEQLIGNGR